MAEKDILIEPRKGRKEKVLPARALMVVNPSEADYALKTFQPFAGASKTVSQTQIVVDKKHLLCLAGPALGAAAAALILEKLVVLGVQEIWLISCCGSLDPSHAIGDILIATGAVSGEGVSRYYADETVVGPCTRITAEVEKIAGQRRIAARQGLIWSTDAPYRERRSELIQLQERYGIIGVDMEFSALCSVASFRGVSLGALFIVSDMLWTRNWKPAFGGSVFKESSRDMIETFIHYGLHKDPEK